MSVTLKVANVWRVLRDVNLSDIRADAEARFLLAIAADTADDAAGVASLVSDGTAPHPWVVVYKAGPEVTPLPAQALAAVLVTRDAALSTALRSARAGFERDQVPIVTVLIGTGARSPAPEPAETARIAGPAIDSRLGRDVLSALLTAVGPKWHLPLARQLPAFRTPVVTGLVEETAQANASYAFASGMAEVVPVLTAPMNLGDMIVLTKNQLVMSYRIAVACGLDGDPRRLIPEIVGVLGGGLLFRQLARQLVGLIPVVGLLPKVAVAYAGTFAIGRAITAWAQEGRELSTDALERLSREGLERGRQIARSLTARATPATRTGRRWDALRRHVPALRGTRKNVTSDTV